MSKQKSGKSAPASARSPSPAAPSPRITSAPSPSLTSSSSPSTPQQATLQVFWDLAKEDVNDRLAACEKLITGLQQEQKQYLASGGDKKTALKREAAKKEEDEDAMDVDDEDDGDAPTPLSSKTLPANICPSLAYALKRLTRGLASSRAGARQGFALALTEILVHLPVVQTVDVLGIVQDQVKLSSKANRQETRDYHLGRVFFALVLVRSKRVTTLAADKLFDFIREIVDYAKTNLPIREVSYETVAQLIHTLNWKSWENSPFSFYVLKEFCNASLENLTIEQIGLYLHVSEFYRTQMKELPEDEEHAIQTPAGDKLYVSSSVRKLFTSKYLQSLHTAMFSQMQHYNITGKLHSTWKLLLQQLWEHHSLERFQKFWQSNVEELLFGGSTSTTTAAPATNGNASADLANPNQIKSTSYQKKFIGFQVVQQALLMLPQFQAQSSSSSTITTSQLLATVFQSRNFMRTFINHLSNKKNVLYSMAMATRKSILDLSAAMPSEILSLITHLEDTNHGGHQRFDARTNSNLIAKLLQGLDEKGIQTYVSKLIDDFVKAVPIVPTTEEAEAAAAAAAAEEAKKSKTPRKAKKGEAAPAAVSTADAMDKLDSAELALASLDSTRNFCIEQLFLLARNKTFNGITSSNSHTAWLHQILQFFFYFGFFDLTSAPAKSAPFPALAHELSQKTLNVLQEKFFHLLNELLPHAPVSKRAPVAQPKKKKSQKDDKKKKSSKKGMDSDSEDEEEEKEGEEKEGEENYEQALANFHALFSASSGKDEDSQTPWVLQLHRDWTTWSSGKKGSLKLLSPLSKEEQSAREESLEFIEELRKKYAKRVDAHKKNSSGLSEEDKTYLSQLRSIQLLLLHLSFLLLKAEDRDFAAPLLEEIQTGATEAFEEKAAASKTPKKKSKAAAEEPEKPSFINVLIDILLSLLIRPSTLFREIAKNTFAAFASSVNEEALNELALVLRRKPDAMNGDDEDEDSDNFPSDDDMDSEEEEEEEETNKKGAKKGEDKKSAKKDEDKKSDKKGEKKGEQKSKKFFLDEQAAANAKKYAKYAAKDSDDEDDENQMIDLEGLNKVFAESDSDEDDPDLDGAAGALDSYDTHLSNIVRLRNERRVAHKETVQQSLHFKLRVCDLVEVYIRTQASNPLIFSLFVPLILAVDAARNNRDNQQLHQRLVGMYKKLCSGKEHPVINAELTAKIRDLMTTLMGRSVKTVSRETLHLTNLAILFLSKLTLPHDSKEQLEAVSALVSSKKSSDSPVAFVVNLYKQELINYISVRHHGNLNTKFFQDFFNKFPALSWAFVQDLASLARAKLPAELQETAADKKGKKSATTGIDENAPVAVTGFLRNDCFLLLHTIFNSRHLLQSNGNADKFLPSINVVGESLRSALLAATLPKQTKEEDEDENGDSGSDSDDEEADKKNGGEEKKKLTKKEKLQLKARAKKKRRLARRKAEAKALAATAEGALSADAKKAKAEHDAHKSTVHRLKTLFKFANQAALTFGTPLGEKLSSPLSALPATLATPLKAAIRTFLISAKVDPAKVKLNIDDSLLNKPNPNQIQKSASNKKANGTAPSVKKENGAAAALAPVKKSNNRNLIVPSVDRSTVDGASVAGKKRPAESSGSESSDKKQKTQSSSAPSPKLGAAIASSESKPKKRSADDSKDEVQKKKKKSEA